MRQSMMLIDGDLAYNERELNPRAQEYHEFYWLFHQINFIQNLLHFLQISFRLIEFRAQIPG